MELMLKRYFWAVGLAFVFVAALLVARTVNTFVGSSLEPAPLLTVEQAPRPLLPKATLANIDVNRVGHLFGIEPPPPPPPDETVAAGAASSDVCWTCEPVKTGMRLQLLGTMVANDKRWSLALINDLDKAESKYFMPGDKVKGCVVWEIVREPQRVVVLNEETHRLEYIDAIPGNGQAVVNTAGLQNLGTAPVPGPGSGDAPPNQGAQTYDIKQKSENEYAIPRATVDKTLGDLNSLAMQARIVPSFKNGVANGFKLFSIRPGSLYEAIGVQNGDVITRINGFDINSPDKALEVYSRLRDSQNIEVEVERRGQLVKKSYAIE